MKREIITYSLLLVVVSALSFGYGVVSLKYLLFPTKLILEKLKPASNLNVDVKDKLEGKELLKELKKGGYILYIRHAKKNEVVNRHALDMVYGVTKTKLKPAGAPEGMCLSEEGKVESWLLGEVFKHLEIPIGEVIASPICRVVQTAEIAFGRVDKTDVNLVYGGLLATLDKGKASEARKNLFLSSINHGKNRIIVGHRGFEVKSLNVAPLNIGEPDTAVFKMVDGKARLVSVMTLFDWTKVMEVESQG